MTMIAKELLVMNVDNLGLNIHLRSRYICPIESHRPDKKKKYCKHLTHNNHKDILKNENKVFLAQNSHQFKEVVATPSKKIEMGAY